MLALFGLIVRLISYLKDRRAAKENDRLIEEHMNKIGIIMKNYKNIGVNEKQQ